MSEDYSQEQLFLIDGFAGINTYHGNSKLKPNEFSKAQNIFTENGTIRPVSESDYFTMPHPALETYTWMQDELAEKTPAAETVLHNVGTQEDFMLLVPAGHSDIAIHEPITLFIMMTQSANSSVQGFIYTDSATAPSADVTDAYPGVLSAGATNETTGEPQWRAITVSASQAFPSATPFWIGFQLGLASSASLELYTHADASGATWKTIAGAAISTTNNPVHFVYTPVGTHVGTGIQVLDLPGKGGDATVSMAGTRQVVIESTVSSPVPNLFVMYAPTESDNNCAIVRKSDTGAYIANQAMAFTSQTVYIVPVITIFQYGNLIYFTHPKTEYCVLLAISKSKKNSTEGSTKEAFHAVVFNGTIALDSWGPTANFDKPTYLDIAQECKTSIFVDTVPDFPDDVGMYALSLFFITGDYGSVVHYMEAGYVDVFGGTENITMGDQIIQTVEYDNVLFFILENSVKALTGVFGNAFLQNVYSEGSSARECAVSTPVGVFMINRNGLHAYKGGGWSKMLDLDRIFPEYDTSIRNANFYNTINTKVVESNNEIYYNIADQKGGVRAYNYYTGSFSRIFKAADIRKIEYIFSYLNLVLPMFGSSRVSPIRDNIPAELGQNYLIYKTESGWIDVNPQFKTKNISRIVIEGNGPDLRVRIQTDASFDTGTPNYIPLYTFTQYVVTDPITRSSEKTLNSIEIPVHADCNKVRLYFESNSSSVLTEIQSIKIYYFPTLLK